MKMSHDISNHLRVRIGQNENNGYAILQNSGVYNFWRSQLGGWWSYDVDRYGRFDAISNLGKLLRASFV
jgi:hypothetical protein